MARPAVRGVGARCLPQHNVDIWRMISVSGGPRSAIAIALAVLRQACRSTARAHHADKARRTCSNRPTLEEHESADVVGDVIPVVWFGLVTDMLTSFLLLIGKSRSIEHLCI